MALQADTGLRLSEALSIRVLDRDSGQRSAVVVESGGNQREPGWIKVELDSAAWVQSPSILEREHTNE
jgi:hypothetical protein